MANRRSILVLGAGYLGGPFAARLADAGHRVIATTRDHARAVALAARGVLVLPLDLAHEASLAGLQRLGTVTDLEVYCLFTPGAFGAAGGVRLPAARLIAALAALPIRRAVLTSSTGVYGECAGEAVTAETSPQPREARSSRLLAIEQAWLAAPFQARLVRLAGLYGPGRVIGLEALRRGERLPGDPRAWLNLIHAADAARLLERCIECDGAQAIELGSDGHPVRRIDYYGHLAARCGFAAPRFDAGAAHSGGSRRCDPATTRVRTGWAPAYADYREGLAAILDTGDADPTAG